MSYFYDFNGRKHCMGEEEATCVVALGKPQTFHDYAMEKPPVIDRYFVKEMFIEMHFRPGKTEVGASSTDMIKPYIYSVGGAIKTLDEMKMPVMHWVKDNHIQFGECGEFARVYERARMNKFGKVAGSKYACAKCSMFFMQHSVGKRYAVKQEQV